MKKSGVKIAAKQENLWKKCTSCDQIIYKKELDENLKVCPKCNSYLRMTARERIEMLADRDQNGKLCFDECDQDLVSQDPLAFYDAVESQSNKEKHPIKHKQSYLSKLSSEQRKTKNNEAVICGIAEIEKHQVVISAMDFEFMGGSMGSVVGEKVTRAAEISLKKKIPLILISASGGARMQEGIYSLMQMAKTSAALSLLHEEGIPVISILCDPTTGGVTASFAMLGDVMVSEPKALVAFAGPRVIEQTIRQKLPEGFQQSEFVLKHGFVDCIVERKGLKSKIASFLNFFSSGSPN